jgi:hypothetical protein
VRRNYLRISPRKTLLGVFATVSTWFKKPFQRLGIAEMSDWPVFKE